jgi:hypothetical protein
LATIAWAWASIVGESGPGACAEACIPAIAKQQNIVVRRHAAPKENSGQFEDFSWILITAKAIAPGLWMYTEAPVKKC